jgi:predicted RNA-binding Zn-ribbon protein involved in translation (DUF1610 family)
MANKRFCGLSSQVLGRNSTMPIMVACGGCGAQLRVRDEYLGRAMKCPKCGQMVRTHGSVEAVPLDKPMPAGQPGPVQLSAAENLPEVLPVRPRRHDDEVEDAPRSQGSFNAYAPCPRCGSMNAERVVWTVWGSFYGPAMLNHVRCIGCGNKYNGRTGRSNLVAATIFVMIPLLLILAIIGGLAWWLWISLRPARAALPPPDICYAQVTPLAP